MKEIEVVAAILINTEGLVYLAERNYGDFDGYWEFPGGKVDNRESKVEALKREIMEELGIEINIVRPFKRISQEYPKFIANLDYFICTSKEEPKLSVHRDAKWVNIKEIKNLKVLPAVTKLIPYLEKENLLV